MVEAQAAARVDRLDQTKDVVILRYLVKNSIEQVFERRYGNQSLNLSDLQNIAARQRHKLWLAKLSTTSDPAFGPEESDVREGASSF